MKQSVWKRWTREFKKNTYALYLASKDSRVPWTAKIIIGFVVAYALSPIDLIPDFIPVIGYLDDLLILPIGIWLAIQIIPNAVWIECQLTAENESVSLPNNWRAGIIIIFIWLLVIGGFLLWALPLVTGEKST
jgi:uncharacterized membrane protein YkvA (DUF1232 family)